MIINKYITIDQIIEDVYRDFGIQEIPWIDAVEWATIIIAQLGIKGAFEEKNTDGVHGPMPIHVNNFKGELPCDLVQINGVRDWESKRSLVYSTNVFKLNEFGKNSDNFRACYDKLEPDWTTWQNLTYDEIIQNQEAMNYFFLGKELYANETRLSVENNFIKFGWYQWTELTYYINNGFIYTNFCEGYLELSYISFPLDSRGYPMIPDDEYYKKAVKSYIMERVAFKLFIQDKLSADKYKLIQQDYHWSIYSAKGHLSVPSLDEMEAIKNMKVRLIDDMRSHSSGFRFNSQRERIWRQ